MERMIKIRGEVDVEDESNGAAIAESVLIGLTAVVTSNRKRFEDTDHTDERGGFSLVARQTDRELSIIEATDYWITCLDERFCFEGNTWRGLNWFRVKVALKDDPTGVELQDDSDVAINLGRLRLKRRSPAFPAVKTNLPAGHEFEQLMREKFSFQLTKQARNFLQEQLRNCSPEGVAQFFAYVVHQHVGEFGRYTKCGVAVVAILMHGWRVECSSR
jgi:hypothetical protein